MKTEQLNRKYNEMYAAHIRRGLSVEDDREIILSNLKRTAIHHKRTCKDSGCNVSLYALGIAYEIIKGKELSKSERSIFI